MVGPHHKRRFVRGMQIVFALVLDVWLLEFLVKPGEAVFVWGFPEQTRENRWSRSLGRTNSAADSGPAQEEGPPL